MWKVNTHNLYKQSKSDFFSFLNLPDLHTMLFLSSGKFHKEKKSNPTDAFHYIQFTNIPQVLVDFCTQEVDGKVSLKKTKLDLDPLPLSLFHQVVDTDAP